jgi:hypothetical protein
MDTESNMTTSRRIAIDFDETYTADPACFAEIVAVLRRYQHRPLIVSCRRNTPKNRNVISEIVGDDLLIILTDLKPKRPFCESMGLPVDIWMDDMPECVERGRQY